ncbi:MULTISPECIES: RNase adapter RapZ [unclassified Moritella]|uniref:RNase adapter RapZ n=1 Tax=unclassified Moritella TaxID=2637987 RepID=UPI001BACC5F3|nr:MULTISPECIES: RNase adapter RapZ [unclassified Moritella]QUM83226.1 RNase adapter RapZ [Moritella sp. 28]QUM87527.1 RNase adapter RapZ [Moritella sp. 36]
MKLIIVSGQSGSGKSIALRVLEDLGYYCVDNLPVKLLPQLLKTLNDQTEKVAVSIDVRNLPTEKKELNDIITELRTSTDLTSLFLDTNQSVLIKRYSETRRLHPLTKDELSLSQAIEIEKKRLSPLALLADLKIDTTELNIHELSEQIKERILGKKNNQLVLVFQSFGFKHGLPMDADYVFDVRFLPNPHWIPELKPYTGLDEPVIKYLSQQPDVMSFSQQIENLLTTWLPMLEKNNRSYVTVAIGCTGGQHRSVFIAEQLAKSFKLQNRVVQTRHQTLEKNKHKTI